MAGGTKGHTLARGSSSTCSRAGPGSLSSHSMAVDSSERWQTRRADPEGLCDRYKVRVVAQVGSL